MYVLVLVLNSLICRGLRRLKCVLMGHEACGNKHARVSCSCRIRRTDRLHNTRLGTSKAHRAWTWPQCSRRHSCRSTIYSIFDPLSGNLARAAASRPSRPAEHVERLTDANQQNEGEHSASLVGRARERGYSGHCGVLAHNQDVPQEAPGTPPHALPRPNIACDEMLPCLGATLSPTALSSALVAACAPSATPCNGCPGCSATQAPQRVRPQEIWNDLELSDVAQQQQLSDITERALGVWNGAVEHAEQHRQSIKGRIEEAANEMRHIAELLGELNAIDDPHSSVVREAS